MSNLVDRTTFTRQIKNSRSNFSVSGRLIRQDMRADQYLSIFYPYLSINQIKEVYGFAINYSRLYGGRSFKRTTLIRKNQLHDLKNLKIGFSLALTNHHFDEKSYIETCQLLKILNQSGNSITCTNNELARAIKKDFPKFKIKASMIKNLDTKEKIEEELDLYDFAVIPMNKNDDDSFLESLPQKERIVIFANANCAYNCPSRICYKAISDDFLINNQYNNINSICSKRTMPRPNLSHIFFDIEKFERLGFVNFKLVPENNVLLFDKIKAYGALRN